MRRGRRPPCAVRFRSRPALWLGLVVFRIGGAAGPRARLLDGPASASALAGQKDSEAFGAS